jgi:23S rRNA-/tRNA-specific pseudouridylate synthase
MKLGGGSQQDFLKPLHRIDQPCSGLLVFGKTSKAASRITKSWKRGLVEKEYLCVVSTDHFPHLLDASSSSSFASSSEEVWYRLDGLLKKSPKCSTSSTPKQNHSRKSTKRSVTILPATAVHRPHDETKKIFREVGLEWMVVSQHHLQQEQLTLLDLSDRYTLLRVRTNQGARHQVRALLSQVGDCPIAGDVRYDGTRSQRHISNETIHPTSQPLPDRSVALHAWRIHFTDQTFKLGSLAGTIDVEAPIPKTWKKFFVG